MDELLGDNLRVAVIDLVCFVIATALALLGPWSPSSWWPARLLWAIGAFGLVLGLRRLVG